MEKPDVDYIEGLSPAISIDQKSTSRNPRSTVGTVTEVYDYLRLLFARVGTPHCYNCGREISTQSSEQIVDSIAELPEGTRIVLLAPLVRGRKGEYAKLFEEIAKEGFTRVRVDGEIKGLREKIVLDKKRKHTIEVVVDRLVMKPEIRSRLADSVETTLRLSTGIVTVLARIDQELTFSEAFACVYCGLSFEELAPRLFSFNSPYGACPACSGLGEKIEIDPWKVIPDRSKSIADGAIVPWSRNLGSGRYPSMNPYYMQQLERVLAPLPREDDDAGRAATPTRCSTSSCMEPIASRPSSTRRAGARRGSIAPRSKASSTTCSGGIARPRANT